MCLSLYSSLLGNLKLCNDSEKPHGLKRERESAYVHVRVHVDMCNRIEVSL